MRKAKTVKRQNLYIGKFTFMETDTTLYHIKSRRYSRIRERLFLAHSGPSAPTYRFVPKAVIFNICEHSSVENGSHCITIHMRRNHQGRFSGLWTGKGAGNGRQAAETR
jgi:hypothetical protein